ncbi:MAG: radical SAM protein [Hyphomicrobiales bacterium]
MNNLTTILISPSCIEKKIRLGESLGIRYLHSYLTSKSFNVDILECDFYTDTNTLIAEKIINYDVVGFSINYYEQYISVRDILACMVKIKAEHFPIIIAGGNYASFKYKSILDNEILVSYIILGEGEQALFYLLKSNFDPYSSINIVCRENYKKHQFIIKENDYHDVDLNSLPFPTRDKNSFHLNNKHFSLMSSRGCYGDCSFCSVSSFSKLCNKKFKWRLRSAENVNKEIDYLYKNYNLEAISFLDSTFLGKDKLSIERALKIAQKLFEYNIKFSFECRAEVVNYTLFKKLKKLGLCNVFIGLESGISKGLKAFNKNTTLDCNIRAIKVIKGLSLSVNYGFIIFFPEMDYQDFIDNLNFLNTNKILSYSAISNKLIINYGTKYSYRELKKVITIDNGCNITYKFKDDRINKLYKEIKVLCKVFLKYEIEMQKLLFQMQVQISNSNIRKEHNNKITLINNKLNSIYYYIATELFHLNTHYSENSRDYLKLYIESECGVLDKVLLK